jgi:hypothetical protein
LSRSIRPDIRNPLLALPAMERMREIDPTAKAALLALLIEIRADARERAETCWRKHKAPMALYWKAVSVYVGHIIRFLKAKGESECPNLF